MSKPQSTARSTWAPSGMRPTLRWLTVTLLPPDEAPAPVVAPPAEPTIVWEDEHLLVIDKPAGLVVHPGAGIASGTLALGCGAPDWHPREDGAALAASTAAQAEALEANPLLAQLVRSMQARVIRRVGGESTPERLDAGICVLPLTASNCEVVKVTGS